MLLCRCIPEIVLERGLLYTDLLFTGNLEAWQVNYGRGQNKADNYILQGRDRKECQSR